MEAPIAKRLETQPGLIAFSWADGAAPALHGQRRSELGFHPGGDQPGLVCCIPQKLRGHHRARLMHQAGHQQGCVEIEGLQKRAAWRRSRTRSAASAQLCRGWRVVAAQKPVKSNAWVACFGACTSRATDTPRRCAAHGHACPGIGPSDEVIMADTNWVATAAPIVHLGAKPVFVDFLPDSWRLPVPCQGHVTTNAARILSSQ